MSDYEKPQAEKFALPVAYGYFCEEPDDLKETDNKIKENNASAEQ